MIVKGIRYRETEGVGCGPVGGPTFVEIMAYDDDGNSSFVIASHFDCDLQIAVSDYPLFDIMCNVFDCSDADYDSEMEKANKLITRQEDYNLDEDEKEGYGHYFTELKKAVDLAVLILKDGYSAKINKKYLNKDLDEIDVPCGPFYEYED